MIMLANVRQSSAELLPVGDLVPRQIFEPAKNRLDGFLALKNLPVAFVFRRKGQAEQRRLFPKLLVVHLGEPFIHFVYIYEFFHEFRMPELRLSMQISEMGAPI